MVNFKRLTDRAKDVVEKRGGKDSLKEDMNELRNIARGEGTLKEKAAAAKDALKDPGRTGREQPPAEATAPQPAKPEPAAPKPSSTQPATGESATADTPEGPRTK
jgi:hypothetical protein